MDGRRPGIALTARVFAKLVVLFGVLDALFGLTFQVPGLASPALRYLYDGLCLLCVLACDGQNHRAPCSPSWRAASAC
jgi:hypothetical protein